jgi:hypothetical protein
LHRIIIDDGLTVRFPHREASFSEGVEIGVLALLMAMGTPEVVRWIGGANVEQTRALADALGYRLFEKDRRGDAVAVLLTPRRRRPALRLVRGAE